MQAQLREISSKFHQATSSAPEIDRVIQEDQKTPFTSRITNVPVPNLEKFKLCSYEGNSDPRHFLTSFGIVINRLKFTSAEQKDAIQCQLFVEHLEGIALDWFSRLEADSIDNYKELSTKFAKHFSMFIGQKTRNPELWETSQGETESLRDFMARFKQIVAHCTVDDEASLEALYQKTWYKSPFHKELHRNRPLTLEDALHKSNIFIPEEEEEAAKDRQYSASKPDQTLAVKENSETKAQSSRQRGVVNQAGPSNHKSGRPPKSWNTWHRKEDTPLSERFCEYHERYGHSTEECQHLRTSYFNSSARGRSPPRICLSPDPDGRTRDKTNPATRRLRRQPSPTMSRPPPLNETAKRLTEKRTFQKPGRRST
ncbi:uncharacterized protein LOC112085099 [Eutrema salsugineum]|uniref:uncharacterized protein LOC112085099 n=1 Tax=Eutrema salsugineum TaxID=72664 RepID=UPI000CED4813|nr:uncharacterized protein LOC112085099 [Eutrema salsugineum]